MQLCTELRIQSLMVNRRSPEKFESCHFCDEGNLLRHSGVPWMTPAGDSVFLDENNSNIPPERDSQCSNHTTAQLWRNMPHDICDHDCQSGCRPAATFDYYPVQNWEMRDEQVCLFYHSKILTGLNKPRKLQTLTSTFNFKTQVQTLTRNLLLTPKLNFNMKSELQTLIFKLYTFLQISKLNFKFQKLTSNFKTEL